MARRIPLPPGDLPRLWTFAREHLLLLPVGAAIALAWANLFPESYYTTAYALSFVVNDVAMVFFFGLMTKEVVEATAPGGVLHPWRRALLPIIAAVAVTALSAWLHVQLVDALDEPALRLAWPVAFGTDVALAYFAARIIFGRHPAVAFVLLLAIASDVLGFVAIAVFDPVRDVNLLQTGAILTAALAIATALRRARVRRFWPYIAVAGGASWYALFRGGFHPALALVPVVPFLPHAARDPGFFIDAPPDARDALNRFELAARYPAEAALFFFGLVNAGVPFHALEQGTWGLPIAMALGRPLGLLIGSGVAVAAGLHLPQRIGWRELLVLGFAAAIGFSVGLFFATALLPPGQLRSEISMGVVMTLAGVPLALTAARLLHVGRFGPHATTRDDQALLRRAEHEAD
jgi:NhaA family Na+:H+ antiporter